MISLPWLWLTWSGGKSWLIKASSEEILPIGKKLPKARSHPYNLKKLDSSNCQNELRGEPSLPDESTLWLQPCETPKGCENGGSSLVGLQTNFVAFIIMALCVLFSLHIYPIHRFSNGSRLLTQGICSSPCGPWEAMVEWVRKNIQRKPLPEVQGWLVQEDSPEQPRLS